MGTIQFSKKNEEIYEKEKALDKNVSSETKIGTVKKEKPGYEDISKRERNVKHYKKQDGTYEAHYFNEPVHYYDEIEKQYKDIDNTLCECTECQESGIHYEFYTNKGNEIKVRFNKKQNQDDLFSLKKGDYEISWKYIPKTESLTEKKVCVGEIQKKDLRNKMEDQILYRDIEPGIDLEYLLTGQRVKENIIVKDKKTKYEYQFEMKVKNLKLELSEDARMLYFFTQKNGDEGEQVKENIFSIPMPFMYDKIGNKSDEVEYGIEAISENKYQFIIRAKADWINHQDREFPVYIDPVIIYKDTSYIEMCSINETGNYPSMDRVFQNQVGRFSGEHYRTYIKFKNLPSFRSIVGAYLSFYAMYKELNEPYLFNYDFEVREVLSEWDKSTMNWLDQPEIKDTLFQKIYYNEIIVNGYFIEQKNAYQFNITTILQNPNQQGLVIKGIDEQIRDGIYFINIANANDTNGYQPNLVIVYREIDDIMSNQQHTLEFGRAGTGSLDLYTKNYMFVHEDISLSGEKMPLQIQHIYQKKYADKDEYAFGFGWRTNYNQTMKPYVNNPNDEEEYSPKYLFINSLGNKIEFYRNQLSSNRYELSDNAGLGLIYDETTRIIQDKDWNKLEFDENGNLIKVKNNCGTETNIYYEKINYRPTIKRIVDGHGREAIFHYSTYSQGVLLLTKISYGEIYELKFQYDNRTLKNIIYPDSDVADYPDFQYTLIDQKYVLNSIRDRTGYKVEYQYTEENVRIKESSNISVINTDGTQTVTPDQVKSQMIITFRENKTFLNNLKGTILVHEFTSSGQSEKNFVIEGNNIDQLDLSKIITVSDNFSKDDEEVVQYSFDKNLWNYLGEDQWKNQFNTQIQKTLEGYPIYQNGFIYQEINVSEKSESFVFKGLFKIEENHENNGSGFRICGNLIYTDGSSEDEQIAEFPRLNTTWQYNQLLLIKNLENRTKKISKVKIKIEQLSSGIMYASDLSLVQSDYTKQYVNKKPVLQLYTTIFMLSQVTGIKYVKENNTTITKPITLMRENDLEYMLKQKINNQIGFIVLNQTIVDRAKVNIETKNPTIYLIINNREYDLFEFNLKYQNSIIIQNNSKSIVKNDYDINGKLMTSTLIDKNQESFKTDYTYRFGKVATKVDFRNMKTSHGYSDQGNLRITVVENTLNQDISNKFIQEYTYDTEGKYLLKSNEERGKEFQTKYTYEENTGKIRDVTNPVNQKTTYTYHSSNGNLLNMIASIPGGMLSNHYSEKRGKITSLSDYKNLYKFDYDGFGTLTKTMMNGSNYDEIEIKEDSDYSSTDESTFNYTKRRFNNTDLFSSKFYEEKSIYDKRGKLLCVEGTQIDGSGSRSSKEEVRIEYDAQERVKKLQDKESGIDYTYDYSLDELDKIRMSGSREGEFKDFYDDENRLIRKSIKLKNDSKGSLEEKNYLFHYEKKGNSTIPDNRILKINLPDHGTVSYFYDNMQRLKENTLNTGFCDRTIYENYTYLKSNFDPLLCENDRTTSYVESVRYSGYDYYNKEDYTYDKLGNMETITDSSGSKVRYQYDSVSRLIREDHPILGFTRIYEYEEGNIKKIKEYDYNDSTTGSPLLGEKVTIFTYYESQLKQIEKNGQTLYGTNYYDCVGNACVYKGNNVKCNRGRKLVEYGNHKYKYNADGIRIEKETAGGIVHKYYLEGSRILKERRGTDEIWYYYDAKGIVGFEYNQMKYYYQKNLQNDIVRIFDAEGRIVVNYVYDAWGNHKVYDRNKNENTADDFIGNRNPFRYRGYYYDRETRLYYCNSRYYDPEVCRWVSADDIGYLDSGTLNGMNLYSYCNNNPVMYSDGSGCFPVLATLLIGLGIGMGSSIFGQIKFEGKSFGELDWVDVIASGLAGSIAGIIPVTGFGTLLIQSAASAFAKNAYISFVNKISIKWSSTFLDFGIGFVAGSLTLGILKSITYGTSKISKIVGGYASLQGKLRSMGMDFSKDTVYNIMYNSQKMISGTKYFSERILDFLAGYFGIGVTSIIRKI